LPASGTPNAISGSSAMYMLRAALFGPKLALR
jgi:hypothetical protein